MGVSLGTWEETLVMGETLSFKVFLRYQNTKGERKKRERKDDGIKENVRRFVLDREFADLGNMKLKISELFPEITDKEYFLSWTDADNDNVTIASDDELAIAIKEMSGPVYPIHINVRNVKKHKRNENNAGRNDNIIKSRKKKTCGVKTGKGHGKDAKKQKQSKEYSKKQKQKSFNYTIYPQESYGLAVLDKLLLINEDKRGFRNLHGIKIDMKVKIKISSESRSKGHHKKKSPRSGSAGSSSSSSSSSRESSPTPRSRSRRELHSKARKKKKSQKKEKKKETQKNTEQLNKVKPEKKSGEEEKKGKKEDDEMLKDENHWTVVADMEYTNKNTLDMKN